jgi:hypothetical protein
LREQRRAWPRIEQTALAVGCGLRRRLLIALLGVLLLLHHHRHRLSRRGIDDVALLLAGATGSRERD